MSFYIRIEGISKKYGISVKKLGERLGYGNNPAKLYRLKDEKKSPSIQIIEDILRAFPEVNARWLIMGEEDILLEDPRTQYGFCKECIKKEGIIEFLKKECAAKDKRIEELLIKGNSSGGADGQANSEKKAS